MLQRLPLLFLLSVSMLIVACSRPPETLGPKYGAHASGGVVQSYRFAIHPLHNPKKLAEAYQPLIFYLNRNLEQGRFELEASRDYQAYEEKLRKRQPDFILANPWQTLQAIDVGYKVVAMAGEAEDFKGMIVVRKDSGINQIADLKGKTVSYPSPTALAACLLPQYFLHKNGIDVNRDITNVYVGSQESSIMNVYLRQTGAGATWSQPWRLFQKEHPDEAAQLRVAWQTEHMQNNAVMARDDLPLVLVQRVTQLLLALQETAEGQHILEGMAINSFCSAKDDDYRPLAHFIRTFEKEIRPVEQR